MNTFEENYLLPKKLEEHKKWLDVIDTCRKDLFRKQNYDKMYDLESRDFLLKPLYVEDEDYYGLLEGNKHLRADFSEKTINEWNVVDANLRGAIFKGAFFKKCVFVNCTLTKCDFTGATFIECIFVKCDLSETIFSAMRLTRTKMTNCRLYDNKVDNAIFCDSRFFDCWILGMQIDHSDFSETTFIGGQAHFNLTDTSFDQGEPDIPQLCPSEGSFIGWKKCLVRCKDDIDDEEQYSSYDVILKLQIEEDAKRSNAFCRKCRCSKARVVGVYNILTGQPTQIDDEHFVICSYFDNDFIYELNKTVEVQDFNEDRWITCASGIHFFMTQKEAAEYMY